MTTKRIKNITPIKIHNPIIVDLKSPWDQKKIAKIECIDNKHINDIIKISSQAFFETEKSLSKVERIDILKKTKEKLIKSSNRFAKIIALEGGKPLKDAKIEVERAVNGLELSVEALNKAHGTEIPMNINEASFCF